MSSNRIRILCQNSQHDSSPITFLCMKEDCDQKSRMACFECFRYTHEKHNADLIEYKDVNNILFIFRCLIRIRIRCKPLLFPMTRHPRNINYSLTIIYYKKIRM